MTTIRASAPGKLFLLGEYAVLDGAPALLTAVDRRVSVTVDNTDDADWRVSTPGLGAGVIALGADGALPPGLDASARERLRVFDAVRTVVDEAAENRASNGFSITIDSSDFFRDGGKLGLGSSAAVAVAFTAALARAYDLPAEREAVLPLALEAHRTAQGGTGSGGDVATSVFGGLIRYSRGTAPIPLDWPPGLSVMAVVTGTGSSTTDLVGRVSEYATRDANAYRADIDRLAALALRAEDALRSPEEFLDLASRYFDALLELDEHSGAGIVSEHHRRLHALAAGLGGVFKTSGAGGGDVGLVFAPAGDVADRLVTAFAEAGAEAVPLGFGASGLELVGTATRGTESSA